MKIADQLRSLVIITGMSGSGKHTAFKAFEDLGYFCVDNLPTQLIPRLVQMTDASGGKISKLAIVVDVRLGEPLSDLEKFFSKTKQVTSKATVIFVDASNEVLARRYSETRRVHPLAQKQTLLQGIQEERGRMAGVRAVANLVIDTRNFSVHDLRNFIYDKFRETSLEGTLNVSLVSFGFKYGLPHNSDLVFDVRFLPNPNFVSELKNQYGYNRAVVDYLYQFPDTLEFLRRILDMLEYLLPRYQSEGKKYLAISIGCTGGKHRSVMMASELKKLLEVEGRRISLIHRDLHSE